MISWDDLLAQRISPQRIAAGEAAPLLTSAGADLETLLGNVPQAPEHIVAILKMRLGGTISADTWTTVETALGNYLGSAAPLVSWVARADQAARMREAETRIPPKAAALLRTILALYGPELALAYERWREIPNDWVRMSRDVFYDEIDKRYLIRVSIDKQNGETVVFEARPGSFLRLISTLVRTARHVTGPGQFDANSVQAFNEEVSQLQQLFATPEDKPAPTS